jgi:multimeric flavodoxin WrbA
VDKIILADALVFGGGNYYGTLNAIGHAFWERTFSLRHNCAFPLAGKLGIAVGLDRDQEKKEATSFIEMMMRSNHMAVIALKPGKAPQALEKCWDRFWRIKDS